VNTKKQPEVMFSGLMFSDLISSTWKKDSRWFERDGGIFDDAMVLDALVSRLGCLYMFDRSCKNYKMSVEVVAL